MELRNRRVLITGASRGIGEALAVSFAREAAEIVLVARGRRELEAIGKRLGGIPHPADLSDPAERAGVIRDVERDVGPIDVLVNNAGIGEASAFAEFPPDDLERTYAVNLVAPARLIRDVLPGMLERGRGHIVSVSSLAACVTAPGLAAYCSSKAGLSPLTATLHHELAGTPIGTTLAEIGTSPTAMLDEITAPGSFGPTRSAFDALYRAHLMVDSPREAVADAIVAAVRRGRPFVRMPRRAAALSMLSNLPRSAHVALMRVLERSGMER
jgi:short-subunit dehydrogenase